MDRVIFYATLIKIKEYNARTCMMLLCTLCVCALMYTNV